MKYKILLSLIFVSSITFAQQKKSTAYAITSEKQGQFIWTEVKLIDLATGEVLEQVYQNNRIPAQAFNARDGKPIRIRDERGAVTDNSKLPFSTFSAACAYDRKHNRLYFTPMYVNELRYIDLGSKESKIFYFQGEGFSKADAPTDEANHITRMTIGADGNGYALSNDGNHFIKFTTGKKPSITDFGALSDDASNKQISVHNKCTSWGGDMVAAADGSLYLVSAARSVFRIDVASRTAKYIAGIEGLPANFTSNGTAVGSNGKLVVSSANSVDGYYEIDMSNWQATKINSKGTVFNTSDLANSNLAFRNETKAESIPLVTRVSSTPNKISLYPNPVAEGMFRVTFTNGQAGRYDIQVVDLTGRLIQQKPITVGNSMQVEEIELNSKLAKGMYLVKVLSNNKKTVYTDKIIVE